MTVSHAAGFRALQNSEKIIEGALKHVYWKNMMERIFPGIILEKSFLSKQNLEGVYEL